VLTGAICFFAVTRLKQALGYDDSLDVFGLHGVGGMVGAILTGTWMQMIKCLELTHLKLRNYAH